MIDLKVTSHLEVVAIVSADDKLEGDEGLCGKCGFWAASTATVENKDLARNIEEYGH